MDFELILSVFSGLAHLPSADEEPRPWPAATAWHLTLAEAGTARAEATEGALGGPTALPVRCFDANALKKKKKSCHMSPAVCSQRKGRSIHT